MIEKLKWIESETQLAYIANEKALEHKINELVDAVNELQNHIADASKKVADRMIGCTTLDIPESYKNNPYIEQRKWIGTLCKFWSDDRNDCVYGILASVLPGIDQPYEVEDCEDWYEHCEPVKPDDDIIYKGGDNE